MPRTTAGLGEAGYVTSGAGKYGGWQHLFAIRIDKQHPDPPAFPDRYAKVLIVFLVG